VRPNVDLLAALSASLATVVEPIVLALVIAGMGHFLRAFAMWAASQDNA
jgi:hypothetical protein